MHRRLRRAPAERLDLFGPERHASHDQKCTP
jgi:hypothetical protein